MTKFEYKAVNIIHLSLGDKLEKELNEYGKNGWELVSFSLNPNLMAYHKAYAIFKRPLP